MHVNLYGVEELRAALRFLGTTDLHLESAGRGVRLSAITKGVLQVAEVQAHALSAEKASGIFSAAGLAELLGEKHFDAHLVQFDDTLRLAGPMGTLSERRFLAGDAPALEVAWDFRQAEQKFIYTSLFQRILKLVAPATADREDTRVARNIAVIYHPEGDYDVSFAASDGHRAAEVRLPHTEDGYWPSLLISPELLGAINAFPTPTRKAHDQPHLCLKVGQRSLALLQAPLAAIGVTVEGEFPRYEDVLVNDRRARVEVDALDLKVGLRAIVKSHPKAEVKLTPDALTITTLDHSATVTIPQVAVARTYAQASVLIDAAKLKELVEPFKKTEVLELTLGSPTQPITLAFSGDLDYRSGLMPLARKDTP